MISEWFKEPDVAAEREFERKNVQGKRDWYLKTNPVDRSETDPAYRAKVDWIEGALGGVDGRVLDIGGNTAGEAAVLAHRGYRMLVGDINETALDISRERGAKFGLPPVEYVAFDAHHLPFSDEVFSAVTIIEALHHMVDYSEVLKEALRVLKPGGLLFAMEPNALNPIRRAGEVRDRFRGTIEKSFYSWDLQRLCENAGFSEIRITPFGIEKPDWKLAEVPRHRRWLFRLHCWLGIHYPGVFGSLAVAARRPGRLGDQEVQPLPEILRCPINGNALGYSLESRRWVDAVTGISFPDLNGIPILISEDT